MVRSISRLKNARPGGTTEHAKFNRPINFPLGDQYYFDKTLPMGLSFSCKLFETFSTAVHWIIDHKLGGL
jgi:hypothetical protein